MRMAESVLFTCWPPAPEARKVSIRSFGLVDLDLDLVVHHGIDEDARERRVPPCLCVEGRDAHEPVNPLLRLQVTVRVIAYDFEGGALDAGLFCRLQVEHRHTVSAALGPPRVHAHEHLGPVLRFETARARVDRQQGMAMIVGALEHGAEFERLDRASQRLDLGGQLGLQVLVVLGLEKLPELRQVSGPGIEFLPRLDPSLQEIGFRNDVARPCLVVPETGSHHLLVELSKACLLGRDVKGTPEARKSGRAARRGVAVFPGS